jgi:hypothetical protein
MVRLRESEMVMGVAAGVLGTAVRREQFRAISR